MTEEQGELKDRLLKRAQASIDRLLKQKAGRRDLSMTEMENLVGNLEMELRQGLMQELVDEVQSQAHGLCPECSGKLRYKGKKRKLVATVRGEVEIERDYYHCAACNRGYFPP